MTDPTAPDLTPADPAAAPAGNGSPDAGPLAGVAGWGHLAAAGWIGPAGSDSTGPADQVFPWASVTKVLAAMAIWVAVEEGTAGWEDEVGPPGSTLRHLLAHASGLSPDSDDVLARPGTRRIYSNRGIELAALHVEGRAGISFGQYLAEAVLDPLGMQATTVAGSPAHGGHGPLEDLARLAGELLEPTLVARSTVAVVTSVAFPGLRGVLPGFGTQEHNDWGLGVEIRDHKHPHWTGSRNSPATFGHFGQSGSLLWVDPEARTALFSLSELPFGPWAAEAWPELSDAVLAAARR